MEYGVVRVDKVDKPHSHFSTIAYALAGVKFLHDWETSPYRP